MRVLTHDEHSFLLFLGRRGRADSTLRKSTLCGDSCGRGQKTEDFLDLCERPSAEIRVAEVKELLRCARDPLRRFVRSRSKSQKALSFWTSTTRISAEGRARTAAIVKSPQLFVTPG